MNLQQALILIRAKLTDELKNITSGETTDKYNNAIKTYPVTMAIALFTISTETVKKPHL
jgi:hypothetical protein